jgi:flagellar basal-body rod protein FlgG
MLADLRQLDVISHNLANATTPGYKRDVMVSQFFGDQLQQQMAALGGGGASGAGALPMLNAIVTDHAAGSLRNTGEALHVALEGDGFLELIGEQGSVYTRAGMLSLAADGTLIGPGGLPVQGLGGDIRLSGPAPRIDREGVIWEGEARIDQLKIVRQPNDGMEKIGSGLFGSSSGALPPVVDDVAVRQGYLENANVDAMTEMVRLIDTMRRFEASQQVARGYDDMLQQALRTIGDL